MVEPQASYSSEIGLPDSDAEWIEFEEVAADASVCRARRRPTGEWQVGDTVHVVGSASGRRSDDLWVQAVASALVRERGWRKRRPRLEVRLGEGTWFHVSAASNRDSIAEHGLDWRRQGSAPGIAGSQWRPELPCVFVCDSREGADFFLAMGRELCDVWAVRVDGLWLESGPAGWDLLPEPVAADRVMLVDRDVDPEAIRSAWATDSTDLMLSGGVTIVYDSHDQRRPSEASNPPTDS